MPFIIIYILFTARIVPRGLKAHPSCLITDIHFKFDEKVEPRVKEFIAEICCDSSFSKSKVVSVPVDERMVSVKKLDPDTHFVARILAVYNDEQKVIGEICNFTTPGKLTQDVSASSILTYQFFLQQWFLTLRSSKDT